MPSTRTFSGDCHPTEPIGLVVAVRVKAVVQPVQPELPATPYRRLSTEHAAIGARRMAFAAGEYMAEVYDRWRLQHGNRVTGPALLVQSDSTFLFRQLWEGVVDAWGNITATAIQSNGRYPSTNHHPTVDTLVSGCRISRRKARKSFDPVSLEIFKHLFASAAEEMGVTLGGRLIRPISRSARTIPCACFDASGSLDRSGCAYPCASGGHARLGACRH